MEVRKSGDALFCDFTGGSVISSVDEPGRVTIVNDGGASIGLSGPCISALREMLNHLDAQKVTAEPETEELSAVGAMDR